MNQLKEKTAEVIEVIPSVNKISRWKIRLILGAAVLVVIGLVWGGTAIKIRGYQKDIERRDAQITEQSEIISGLEIRIKELEETPIPVVPIRPEIVLDTINSGVRMIGELATTEYFYTNSARFTDAKMFHNFTIPGTKKSFIAKWDGVIKAGVDVNRITIVINPVSNEIVVTMPKARILSHELDEDSFETLDEKDGIFNKVTLDDTRDFDAANKKAMEQRAIENGLLEKAEENAKAIITNMITVHKDLMEQYTIRFVVEGR